MYVTNRRLSSSFKKTDAYNRAFVTKFATFLQAAPNIVRWGHLKLTQTRKIKQAM